MSTSVGVMPNEESRGWCWAAESRSLFQLTAGPRRGHLFMASVYNSFVDLTKMLLAKSNSYWGRAKGKGGFFVLFFCFFACFLSAGKCYSERNYNKKWDGTSSKGSVRVLRWDQSRCDLTQGVISGYFRENYFLNCSFRRVIGWRIFFFFLKWPGFSTSSNHYYHTARKRIQHAVPLWRFQL